MDLRDLRTLVAVLRHGSFTAAAEELGCTQAAVSQQIAGLERELGHVLLTRRPTVATDAGARLAEHARAILLRAKIAQSEMAALDDRPGPVRIRAVASPGTALDLLVAGIRRMRGAGQAQHTDPVVTVAPGIDEAIGAVASAEADVALVAGMAGTGKPLRVVEDGLLCSVTLVEEPYVVVLPADHPLGRRKRLDAPALHDITWVHLPEATSHDGWGEGLTALAGATHSAGPGQDPATVLSLVAAGVGAALLPDRPTSRRAGVVAVPLTSPLVHRNELLTLRTARPDVNRLIAQLAHGADQPSDL